jgi:hypothetical protein
MHGRSIPILNFQKSPLPLFSKEGTIPPFKKGSLPAGRQGLEGFYNSMSLLE